MEGPCGCLSESLPTLGWAGAHLGVGSNRGQQCEQFVHTLRGREQGVDSAQAGGQPRVCSGLSFTLLLANCSAHQAPQIGNWNNSADFLGVVVRLQKTLTHF